MVEVGERIGNFIVRKIIGEGGMGTVYLGEHPLLDRKVAIKVISPRYVDQPDVVARFFGEARAVSRLGHPHIVEVFDCGQEHGITYIIMEYLEGETLGTKLARKDKLRSTVALHVAAQIASAISVAHQKRIWHRDLKPENIFIIRRPEDTYFVKVLDFGLCKLIGDEKVSRRTQAGTILGSPGYMSPEQGSGRSDLDGRTDIYSLGVILFEMLTGRLPFTSEERQGMILQHMTIAPPRLRSIEIETPPWLDDLVGRMLVKDPAQRIGSMYLVKEMIKAGLRGKPVSRITRALSVPKTDTGRAGIVAAMIGLPIVAGLGAWAVVRQTRGSADPAASSQPSPTVAVSPPVAAPLPAAAPTPPPAPTPAVAPASAPVVAAPASQPASAPTPQPASTPASQPASAPASQPASAPTTP